MDVYVSATKEAAGSGGALLAKYAWWKRSHPEGSFVDMTNGEAMGLECVAKPRKEVSAIYDGLVVAYDECEARVVQTWAAKSGAEKE